MKKKEYTKHMPNFLFSQNAYFFPLRAQVAEECLEKASDLSGLLLLHSARGSVAGLGAVVAKAEAAGRLNVAFLGQLLLGRLDACVDLLLAAGRIPEAAFFARTYLPSRISEARPTMHLAVLHRGCMA